MPARLAENVVVQSYRGECEPVEDVEVEVSHRQVVRYEESIELEWLPAR